MKIYSVAYPGRVGPPSAQYPGGSPIDLTTPGTGTPLQAGWLGDSWGFFYALLDAAGLAPDDTPEGVGTGQLLGALQTVVKNSTSNTTDLVFSTVADMQAGKTIGGTVGGVSLQVGNVITILSRGNGIFIIQTTTTPNGFNIIDTTNGNEAALISEANSLSVGCAADGSTNDTDALLALDALGGGEITGGTIRVQGNIALTGNYTFKSGGIIAPDSAFTITWSGSIEAGDFKIFDGNFKVSKVNKVPEVKVAWFGALSSDLDSDMADQALADSNAKAIRQARNMVVVGPIPAGIYVTPVLRLLNGLCIVDDDDNDGVILDVVSYMTVLGLGDSSVLRPKNSAKAFDIVSTTEDSAASIVIDDFHIYGEASEQVNTQHGLTINPPTAAQIYNKVGNGLYIKEMSGHGARMLGFGWENSKFNPKLVRDSKLHNLLVTKCNEVEFTGCTYRTAKSGQSGAVFSGAGVISAHIHHNNFDENNVNGLIVTNTGGRHRIHDNGMKSNFTGQGATFDRVDHSQIHGNKFEANGTRGATLDNTTDVDWENNKSRGNQQNGQSFGCNNSSILNNSSYGDGQGADDTYSGITLSGASADDNNVQGNKVRHGGGATQLKYGLEISPSGAATNLVTNNDLKNSGKTADLFDDGGGTITAPGNRV